MKIETALEENDWIRILCHAADPDFFTKELDTYFGRATVLHACVQAHNERALALLLSAGANPNVVVSEYNPSRLRWCERSPLHVAADVDSLACTSLLLSHGADANGCHQVLSEHADCSPVHIAASHGYADIVEVLLKHGANPNAWSVNTVSPTPLMAAARCGHAAVVQLLLSSGATMDVRSPSGRTALSLAAQFNRTAVLDVLLGRGAQLNLANKEGFTALHDAAVANNVEAAAVLVRAGADASYACRNGLTALDVAMGVKPINKRLLSALSPGSTRAVVKVVETVALKPRYSRSSGSLRSFQRSRKSFEFPKNMSYMLREIPQLGSLVEAPNSQKRDEKALQLVSPKEEAGALIRVEDARCVRPDPTLGVLTVPHQIPPSKMYLELDGGADMLRRSLTTDDRRMVRSAGSGDGKEVTVRFWSFERRPRPSKTLMSIRETSKRYDALVRSRSGTFDTKSLCESM